MARVPKVPNTTAIRVGAGAIRLARIAAGYTAESMAEYVTRIVTERAREDIEKSHRELHE
jgi:hypothetical protein